MEKHLISAEVENTEFYSKSDGVIFPLQSLRLVDPTAEIKKISLLFPVQYGLAN